MRALLTTALLLLASTALGGPLQNAFDKVDDGRIRFSYQVREGVYGDGRSIITRDDADGDWIHECDCANGPARVRLTVRDGRIVDMRVRVGASWRGQGSDQDLGEIDADEVVTFFLDQVEGSGHRAMDDAIFAASIARGFDEWARIVDIARNDEMSQDVRESAIFWLGQAASERATADLVAIVDDDDTELELREHAIFALSQRHADECLPALTRVAQNSRHPQLREQALFWMAQHDDPRVVDLFEEILLR